MKFTQSERNWIYALKQAGFTPSAAALPLERHKSTADWQPKKNLNLQLEAATAIAVML